MLASDPASILNQNRTDLGIPNRFNPKESDSSRLRNRYGQGHCTSRQRLRKYHIPRPKKRGSNLCLRISVVPTFAEQELALRESICRSSRSRPPSVTALTPRPTPPSPQTQSA